LAILSIRLLALTTACTTVKGELRVHHLRMTLTVLLQNFIYKTSSNTVRKGNVDNNMSVNNHINSKHNAAESSPKSPSLQWYVPHHSSRLYVFSKFIADVCSAHRRLLLAALTH